MTVLNRTKRDHGRAFRIFLGTVFAALLVVAPQVAQATFTSSKSANLSVGTLNLAAPASTTKFDSDCPSNGKPDRGFVSVSFAEVPLARGYSVTLSSPTGGTETVTSSSPEATLKVPYIDNSKRTWTVSMNATAASWSGPALSRTFRC